MCHIKGLKRVILVSNNCGNSTALIWFLTLMKKKFIGKQIKVSIFFQDTHRVKLNYFCINIS